MSAYDKLVIVDQYEARHANRAAVRRACSVMLQYLSSLRRPLPEMAERTVKIVQAYAAGMADVNALSDAEARISLFLNESNGLEKGSVSVVRASRALLMLMRDPEWGGGASEVLSNFLEWTDEFDQDHVLFEQILEQIFGMP